MLRARRVIPEHRAFSLLTYSDVRVDRGIVSDARELITANPEAVTDGDVELFV
jgi:hypothetical protein